MTDAREALQWIALEMHTMPNPHSIIEDFDGWFAFAVMRAELLVGHPGIVSWWNEFQ